MQRRICKANSRCQKPYAPQAHRRKPKDVPWNLSCAPHATHRRATQKSAFLFRLPERAIRKPGRPSNGQKHNQRRKHVHLAGRLKWVRRTGIVIIRRRITFFRQTGQIRKRTGRRDHQEQQHLKHHRHIFHIITSQIIGSSTRRKASAQSRPSKA